MNIPGIAYVCDKFGILVGSLGICPFTGNIIYGLTVLALVPGDHIYRLLQQVEIEVLVTERGREIEITVYKGLGTCIK
jgi:hypothetical protein